MDNKHSKAPDAPDAPDALDRVLNHALDDARRTYRVPSPPDAEAIWRGVERELFTPAVRRTGRGQVWRAAGLAAAALVIGVLAGRWSTRAPAGAPPASLATLPTVSGPYQLATEDLLGRAAVLLSAIRTTDVQSVVNGGIAEQASQLLGSTRLLLDSPAANDPRMHSLLLDLELTLAGISRLQPARGDAELNLINNAVAERDIGPRIRAAVVNISGAY